MITIKGAKGLVDSQFFMYHVYFDNVSHITLNDININFLHYFHLLMNLSSYEFEIISLYCEGPFAYAKDLLIGAKNNHKI